MLKLIHKAFLYPHPLISNHSPSQTCISFNLSQLCFLQLTFFPSYFLHLTLSHSSPALVHSSGCWRAVLRQCCARVCVCVQALCVLDCCRCEKHADYRSAHKCFTLHPRHESIASGFKSRQ